MMIIGHIVFFRDLDWFVCFVFSLLDIWYCSGDDFLYPFDIYLFLVTLYTHYDCTFYMPYIISGPVQIIIVKYCTHHPNHKYHVKKAFAETLHSDANR